MIQRASMAFSRYGVRGYVRPNIHIANTSTRTKIRSRISINAPYFVQRSFTNRIPPKSWDSHMHVVDPTKYPLVAGAQYTPKPHVLSQALDFESSVGISNIVLVQPSIYGNDNSCMLDTLRELGPERARAVVTFDPKEIAKSQLEEWHEIGVRGVRINLQSVGKEMDSAELAILLQNYADIIRPFDWVLQLYVPLTTATILEKIVPNLGVKVCLDHFGHPLLPKSTSKPDVLPITDPYSLPGFQSLINLIQQGNTYVKMSAPYRISSMDGHEDLEPVARELLKIGGMNRVVFATDWPHTRFDGLDIRPFMSQAIEWCNNDKVLIDRIFRYNAEDLWDVS